MFCEGVYYTGTESRQEGRKTPTCRQAGQGLPLFCDEVGRWEGLSSPDDERHDAERDLLAPPSEGEQVYPQWTDPTTPRKSRSA